MSDAKELLNRVKRIKNDIHRASFENRDKRITTKDHGHGYISLNIPAAKKHRERHLERVEQPEQAARTSG
jgi:hypothetical protein